MIVNALKIDHGNLKQKAVKSAGINILTNFLGFLFHTASVIILARLLSPRDFGLVAMVTAFSILPMNFGLNGFIAYIIQKDKFIENEINAIFWVHFIIATALAIGFVVFGIFLAEFYSEPSLKAISAAMASSFILVALSTTHGAILRREMKYGSLAIGDLVAGLVSIACAIGAAMGGLQYWAVVIRQLVSPALLIIILWYLCPWRPAGPINIRPSMNGLKYGLKVYANFTVDYLTKNIDKVLIGRFFGSQVLGKYDRGYNLSTLPAGQILMPLSNVVLSTLSRLQNDKVRFVQYYMKAVSMVSFLGTIAAVGLMLTARDLVPLLLGRGWEDTGIIIMAFSPGIAAMLVDGTISWLHLSLGTPGRWLKWNIVSTIITILIFCCAVPYGAVAMAAAYSIAKFILVLPGLWYAGRPVELSVKGLLRSIWPYIAAGLITAIIWLSVAIIWPKVLNANNGNHIENLIATVLGVPILYILCIISIHRSFAPIREYYDLLKIFFLKKGDRNCEEH